MRKFEYPSAFVLYLVLIALAYGSVLFASRSLPPVLLQQNDIAVERPAESAGQPPASLLSADTPISTYDELAINTIVAKSYIDGELPLWNRFQAGGAPLAARYTTRAFSPYQVLENLGPVKYRDYFLIGRLLIAGFFTFLFLRLTGLPFAPAFLSGGLYMLSPAFTRLINLEQFANNAMWLPPLMWALERLATKRSSWHLPLAAVLLAINILAGQPHMALYSIVFATLYFILRALALVKKEPVLRSAKRFALASLLSVALAAPLLLPFGELVKNSYETDRHGTDIAVSEAALTLPPGSVTAPAPKQATPPDKKATTGEETARIENGLLKRVPGNGALNLFGGYTGSVALYLLIAGLLTLPFSRNRAQAAPLLFFTGIGALILLKSLNTGPFALLNSLPFSACLPTLLWAAPVAAFSFAAGAGLAFETVRNAFNTKKEEESLKAAEADLLHYDPDTTEVKKRELNISAFIVPVVALGLCLAILFYLTPPPVFAGLMQGAGIKGFLRAFVSSGALNALLPILFLVAGTVVLIKQTRKGRALDALIPLALIELWWAIGRGYSNEWLYLKLIPVIIGLYVVLQFFKGRRKSAALTVVLLFAAIMLIDYNSPGGWPDRNDRFAPLPYVEFLQKEAAGERIVAGGEVLLAGPSLAPALWKIKQSGSVDNTAAVATNVPYYSLLSARYLLLPAGNEPVTGLRALYSDNGVSIYENRGALPRAYIVNEIEVAKGREEAEERAETGRFILGKAALIEKEAPFSIARVADNGVTTQPEIPQINNTDTTGAGGYGNDESVAIFAAGGVDGNDNYDTAPDGANAPLLLEQPEASVAGSVAVFNDSDTRAIEEPITGGAVTTEVEKENAKILVEKSNSVRIEATGPGLLVLTDSYYPGWSAKVDGEKAQIYRVNGLVRGVFITSGSHIVDFGYLPRSFLAGIIVAGISLISCLWYGFRCEKERTDEGAVDEKEEI